MGIADAKNLALAYPPRPATTLMPTVRSVIVMAVAYPRIFHESIWAQLQVPQIS